MKEMTIRLTSQRRAQLVRLSDALEAELPGGGKS
jgi:hypothetical protein